MALLQGASRIIINNKIQEKSFCVLFLAHQKCACFWQGSRGNMHLRINKHDLFQNILKQA